MPEWTGVERRWEAWFAAWQRALEQAEVSCPEGDGGRVQLTYYGLAPQSRVGSVEVWCDRGLHGIFLGRVGIPAGAQVTPFGETPEERSGLPEIELIPPAMGESQDSGA
jgi:hypothetical protein